MTRFFLFFAAFLSACLHGHAANALPDARNGFWQAGVNVGVTGGLAQYLPGGAFARTHTGTNDTDELSGTISGDHIDVSLPPYSADKTGVSDCKAIIELAISHAGTGQVIYFPAGTYRINSAIATGTKANVTMRGDGAGQTILDFRYTGSYGIILGGSSFGSRVAASGTLTKGASELTVADASPYPVGMVFDIEIDDERSDAAIEAGAIPVYKVDGRGNNRKQKAVVLTRVSNTITFAPSLFYDNSNGTAAVAPLTTHQDYFGIEGMTLEMNNGTVATAVWGQQQFGGWLYEVAVSGPTNYGIFFDHSLNVEVRRCILTGRSGGGTNGAGVLIEKTTSALVEDNILINWFPSVEVNFGTTGLVFAYNLCENQNVTGYFALDSNHGPHPSFNLYEGNVAQSIEADGFFGTVSDDTIARNWFHGSRYDNVQTDNGTVKLKRFTRNYTVIGNILGKSGVVGGGIGLGEPNIGNGNSDGTADPTSGDFWIDWKMTGTLSTRSSDTTGEITLVSGSMRTGQDQATMYVGGDFRTVTSVVVTLGGTSVNGFTTTYAAGKFTFAITSGTLPAEGSTIQIHPGPKGYQESDSDVAATLIEKGNYSYGASGAAGSTSSLGGDTVSDSYFRGSKPAYFGALAWPPFGTPGTESYESIPAGYRWLNDAEVPSSGATATITTLNVGTLVLP